MNYDEIKKEYKVVRKKILEIKEKGQLKRNIYLSESEKVTKAEIEEYIDNQIEIRGLDWRAGYLIRFSDGLQLDFMKMNGDAIKN